ncbi:MAG: EAL domain-containing protein [Ruminococcaceae bacterium]|nr:EAL domain-containing protein [Oscillospiraceae bacterium]
MSDYQLLNEILKDENATEKERALAKGELTYRALFDNVNGGGYISTVSLDSEFISVTEGLCRLFGKTEKEFLEMTSNKPINMIYSPDSRWAVDTVADQLRVGDRSEVTYRILDEFGNIKWLHDVGRRIIGPDGEERLFGTVTDITEMVEANERLKDASYELETLMTNIPGGICVFEYENGRMKISYANEEYFVLNGFTSEYFYMIGDMDISRFIKEDEYPAFCKALEKSLKSSSSFEFEYQVNRNDGINVFVSMKAKVFKYHGDNPVFYSVIWDTTERKQMENQLYLQSERYKAIEENMDELPFDYVIATDTLIVSKIMWTRPGLGSRIYDFFKQLDSTDYIHPDFKEELKKNIERAKRQKYIGSFEFQGKFRDDGLYHWYKMHFTNVLDGNGVPERIVGRVNVFDEEKKAQEEIERRLMNDEMTGLYNKTACEKIISEQISEENHTGALLVLDIDNFKLINDTFGHTFGDTVIENFAHGIKAAAWDGVTVGRIGGDEFLIYIPDASEDNATATAEQICTLMKETYIGEQMQLPESVGCSIGIAFVPEHGNDFSTVFDKADLAMYYSKSKGKNRFSVFKEEMLTYKNDIMSIKKQEPETVKTSRSTVYDSEFTTYTFSLLSHSRDIDSSLNLLLERIGKQFDLSFVAVLEDIQNDGYMHFTNIWHFEDGIQYLDSMPPLHAQNTRFIPPKANGPSIYKVRNTANMKKDRDVGELLFSSYNCHSFAGIRFPEGNQVDGCIFFSDCVKVHEWTEFELGTFSELARIISVFISLRRERIRSSEQIELLSTKDGLTGLYNQDAFIKMSKDFIKEYVDSKVVALIYTDINGFSYVNENFGYEAGDKMLCDFADAISIDTGHPKINGRVYSDFFLTISAVDSKQEIIDSVDGINTYFIGQQRAIYPASNLSLSTGIYFVTEVPDHSVSMLIENANLARKESKTTVSSYYIYDDTLSKKRMSEQTAANDLHQAINTGELRLFLQPKFSLETREVVGAEALVRWILPDGTMRYPDEFLPILERMGYIVELDFFIYEKTLMAIRSWLDKDKAVFPISVNFSRRHLNAPDFVKQVYYLTQKYNVPPEYIELEITESESINDNEHFLTVMEQFHRMGFRIDIDDFGTGYSSLHMLLDAPFDVVKIDKSFITDVDFSDRYLTYLQTLIKLIRTSGKEMIFEGVETETQARYLLQCGAENAQGYLFSKAISVNEYEEKYVK